MADATLCAFCNEPLSTGETVKLTEKGCLGISKACEAREKTVNVVPGQRVHTRCRSMFTNTLSIESSMRTKRQQEIDEPKVLRSATSTFNYQNHCLFCGCSDPRDGRDENTKLIAVRTTEFQRSVIDACDKYPNEWSDKVRSRILFVSDLPAADAVYHKICSGNFRTGKPIPVRFADAQNREKRSRLSGRPKNDLRSQSFEKVVQYFVENDDEQITVNDLCSKMAQYLSDYDIEPYSAIYMKNELKKRFGDDIIFAEIYGKPEVVTFYASATQILNQHHQKKFRNENEENEQIVTTAAKLILSEIKGMEQSKEFYPGLQEISSVENAMEFVPSLFKKLLMTVFSGKDTTKKVASIGQAVVQAARPRVLVAPLQLGLGVQLHHHFQSRFLIDSLNTHGFCCSYDEVKRFERCAAVIKNTELPDFAPGDFVQYAADNVDHNIRTLDGKNTFHGMGMVAAVTPKRSASMEIRRKDISSDEIRKTGKVDIISYNRDFQILDSLTYKTLRVTKYNLADSLDRLSLLWKLSMVVNVPCPMWNGFMQETVTDKHCGSAAVCFLPIIDLDPSDVTCVYSTMRFISSHAAEYSVPAIITFDQPLWWKAFLIAENEPMLSKLREIVVQLGGFHTEMSFLGCVGHLMSGSGLNELLEEIYAPNAVIHILSGKAVARAKRAHYIVYLVLFYLLACKVHGDEEESLETGKIFTEVKQLIENMLSENPNVEQVVNSDVLQGFAESIQEIRGELKSSSKTAKLWIQYMDMVELLQKFITAERTGNWELYLAALREMLPYFAASGHHLYAKSVYLYIQKMQDLKTNNPAVYKAFCEGFHVVRRTDRFWAGLPADLIIEQCLMRSIKTTGGLTRGRGLTDVQIATWTLSTPICSSVNEAMQHFTGRSYTTSEQHKDCTKSRIERDQKDCEKVLNYLKQRNPLETDVLMNIASGVTSPSTVNAHEAVEVGEKIISSMNGQKVSEFTFRKKDQCVTMDSSSSVTIKGEKVTVDPQLLFQRLVSVGSNRDELPQVFEHELCAFPSALFETSNVMRTPNKATLAEALWDENFQCSVDSSSIWTVLDGGGLIHRIPWTRGTSFEGICQQYLTYMKRYSSNTTVVFDGYSGNPSTKDSTHLKRSTKVGATVLFTKDMLLQSKKAEFLANEQNKQRFIFMLAEYIEEAGFSVIHAEGDADYLIVMTAVRIAASWDVAVVGDDTDLLVLLCHHAKDCRKRVYFKPEAKRSNLKKSKCWDIQKLLSMISRNVSENIVFLHAFFGCDTTSALYGIGKKCGITLCENRHFLKQARVFSQKNNSKDAVEEAGEKAMVCVYGGKLDEQLNQLRLRKFCNKSSTASSLVTPQSLPPTAAATKNHSLRVYLQVQNWIHGDSQLQADDWGWRAQDGKLIPVMTDLAPAPQNILEVIKCNCKTGCATMRCSCRKNGIECSLACSECRGVCKNSTYTDTDADV